MSESRWVQHISGQTKKWELYDAEYNHDSRVPDWLVKRPSGNHYLPKSEYVLCDPPEIWLDVTKACEILENGSIMHDERQAWQPDYRRRKIEVNGQFYIVVEKKV